jgi:hypothetical protein
MIQKNLQKGDFVFKRGEEGNEIYILEEGKVDISVGNHTVLSLQPGEMCGEHSLMLGRPRNVTAKCVSEECKLHGLRARDFYELLDAHPKMKAAIRDTCLRREFQKALCVKTKKSFPKTESELRAAFKAVDRDKDGVIELPEIRSMILNLDPTYTEEDIKDILVSLDLNDSGTVTWEEFKRIFGMNGGRSSGKLRIYRIDFDLILTAFDHVPLSQNLVSQFSRNEAPGQSLVLASTMTIDDDIRRTRYQ